MNAGNDLLNFLGLGAGGPTAAATSSTALSSPVSSGSRSDRPIAAEDFDNISETIRSNLQYLGNQAAALRIVCDRITSSSDFRKVRLQIAEITDESGKIANESGQLLRKLELVLSNPAVPDRDGKRVQRLRFSRSLEEATRNIRKMAEDGEQKLKTVTDRRNTKSNSATIANAVAIPIPKSSAPASSSGRGTSTAVAAAKSKPPPPPFRPALNSRYDNLEEDDDEPDGDSVGRSYSRAHGVNMEKQSLIADRERQEEMEAQREELQSTNRNLALERARDLIEVERTVRDVQDVFRELSVLVHDQGDDFKLIESGITEAVQHVEKGTEELIIAHKYKSSTRTKWFFLFLLGVIVLVVLLVIWFAH